jgi:hypothetical protein
MAEYQGNYTLHLVDGWVHWFGDDQGKSGRGAKLRSKVPVTYVRGPFLLR